mmetsp:Transcript_52124/g.84229  ORF Transcript_52124/g.84229 Transcript_52124/m.84229 type:complete len:319 (+) Transcript_52124:27-983(+)
MGTGGSSGCLLVVFAALVVSSAAFLPSAVLPAVQTQLGASSSVCSVSMNQQRVAVVTGANKGIGLEVSRILGRQPGVLCVMGCRNAQLGQQAAAVLQKEGCNVTFAQLDINDKSSIANFAGMIKANYGGFDILVNNAAIAYKGRDPTPFAEQARPTLYTNFYGTLALCDALVPLLRNGGRVSNVASMSGPLRQFPRKSHARVLAPDFSRQELCELIDQFVESAEKGDHGRAGWPNTCYGVSKAALNALTRIMARELAPRNILVNSCCPGWCATDMSSHSGPRSAAQGADTPAFLAMLPAGSRSGEYWTDRQMQDWSRS